MGTRKLPESYKVPWDREKVRSKNPDDQEEYFKKTAKFQKNVQTEVGIKHNRLVDAFENHLKLLHIEDQKTSGTASGDFNSGAWRTRDLNTVCTNEISGASLSSNQITLPAGTYEIEWSAPGFRVDRHNTRLRDTTNSTTLLSGTSEFAQDLYDVANRSFGFGRFTLSGSAALELQHQCQTTYATYGFGADSGSIFTVDHETYSIVKIRKIA